MMYRLRLLVEAWEEGLGGYEHNARFGPRAARHCRLLEKAGYAVEVRAVQGAGWQAYKATPAGVARWDRHFLTAS